MKTIKRCIESPISGLVVLLVGMAMDVWSAGWGWVALSIGGCLWTIATLWVENVRLKANAEPKLSLRYAPTGGPTDLYDSYHTNPARNDDWRYLRIGVVNTGDTAENVAILFSDLSPPQYPLFPMQELDWTHHKGTSRFTVHKTIGRPQVLVEVLLQKLASRDGSTVEAFVPFNSGYRTLRLDTNRYEIALTIDGKGAGKPQRFEWVRDAKGQFEMHSLDA